MARPTLHTAQEIARRIEQGLWDETTLSDIVEANSGSLPGRLALTDSAGTLNWETVQRLVTTLAAALASRFDRDAVLALCLPNSARQFIFRVACEAAGVVCAPVLAALGPADVARVVTTLNADAVVAPPAALHSLRKHGLSCPCIAVEASDGQLLAEKVIASLPAQATATHRQGSRAFGAAEVSFLLGTSGTTGAPMFVEHGACHRLAQWRRNAQILGLGRDDVFGLLSPHPGGVSLPGFFGAPLLGAHTVFLESFDPGTALDLVQEHEVTIACVVPTQLRRMAEEAGRRGISPMVAIRCWWCAGAPLTPELAAQAEETLGGVVLNVYGATDWGGETWTTPEEPPHLRLGTVGKPRDGTCIRIVSATGESLTAGHVGEVQGSGPNCVSGYWKDHEANANRWTPDGWFKTGDAGSLGEDGYLRITGRFSDTIIRGGQNVHPAELEALLQMHPAVQAAAVVPYSDQELGQRICAVVVTRGDAEIDLEGAREFLKNREIARFKLPDRLEIVKELPHAAGGQKLDRRSIREKIS